MAMARLANSVDTQLAYVKEEAWGVTPNTPAFKKLRVTSESLNAGMTTVASQELRPDRNVTDLALVAASAAGSINMELSYGTFDDMIESVLFGNWESDAIVNGGSSNMKSFTLEKRFDMGSGVFEYFRYSGMVPNSMNLTLGVDAIITGSFEFMGKGEAPDTTMISGATYAEAANEKVLNATSDFASFSIGGDAANYVRSMDMTIANNLRTQRAVANLSGVGVGTGQCSVTGSMSIYFKNRAIYDKFLKNESVALTFVVGEEPTKRYRFTLPRIKFSQGAVQAGGLDQELACEMQYQALYDAGIGGTIKIERAVA